MNPQNSVRCLLIWVALLLGGCASTQPILPEPLVKPRAETHPEELEQKLVQHGEVNKETVLATTIQSTPKPPLSGSLSTLKTTDTVTQATTTEEANITVAFDQMPLPNFVQAIYSLILKKNYSMDPQVSSRKDLVTLRASQLQTASQIENAARLLLKT